MLGRKEGGEFAFLLYCTTVKGVLPNVFLLLYCGFFLLYFTEYMSGLSVW
jgi:hypothetical protein